eukprot:1175408-Prorocentrum_minimum.AAC.3
MTIPSLLVVTTSCCQVIPCSGGETSSPHVPTSSALSALSAPTPKTGPPTLSATSSKPRFDAEVNRVTSEMSRLRLDRQMNVVSELPVTPVPSGPASAAALELLALTRDTQSSEKRLETTSCSSLKLVFETRDSCCCLSALAAASSYPLGSAAGATRNAYQRSVFRRFPRTVDEYTPSDNGRLRPFLVANNRRNNRNRLCCGGGRGRAVSVAAAPLYFFLRETLVWSFVCLFDEYTPSSNGRLRGFDSNATIRPPVRNVGLGLRGAPGSRLRLGSEAFERDMPLSSTKL